MRALDGPDWSADVPAPLALGSGSSAERPGTWRACQRLALALLVAFVVWTALALQWKDIGCDYPEAYLA